MRTGELWPCSRVQLSFNNIGCWRAVTIPDAESCECRRLDHVVKRSKKHVWTPSHKQCRKSYTSTTLEMQSQPAIVESMAQLPAPRHQTNDTRVFEQRDAESRLPAKIPLTPLAGVHNAVNRLWRMASTISWKCLCLLRFLEILFLVEEETQVLGGHGSGGCLRIVRQDQREACPECERRSHRERVPWDAVVAAPMVSSSEKHGHQNTSQLASRRQVFTRGVLLGTHELPREGSNRHQQALGICIASDWRTVQPVRLVQHQARTNEENCPSASEPQLSAQNAKRIAEPRAPRKKSGRTLHHGCTVCAKNAEVHFIHQLRTLTESGALPPRAPLLWSELHCLRLPNNHAFL